MQDQFPAISIVVPIYNVEEYLPECIDSLLNQDIPMEIILVNDGSTDSSGDIADSYQKTDNRVKVIHQENRGVSVARNTGLEYSSGKYVVFIDSDDYIEKDSLKRMFGMAEENDADMVMGKITYCYPDGRTFEPFSGMIKEHEVKSIGGKDWFVSLFSSGLYYLMVCNYMFHRDWLIGESLYFDPVLHEDELWTPVVLSKAKKVIITDYPFYYYRQRAGSTMHTLTCIIRLKSLLYIADRLAKYSASYSFSEDKAFKSWLWADIYRLYFLAFGILPRIRDSSFILPRHYLYALPKIYRKMDRDARLTAKEFYLPAKQNLGTYLSWLNHPSMKREYNPQKQHLVLLYNIPDAITIAYKTIPEHFYVTADRKYLQEAGTVIFHMPDLYEHLEDDLDKPDNQIWIAWFGREEEHVSFLQDGELSELFDIRMIGYRDIDVQYMKEENNIDRHTDLKSLAGLCKLLWSGHKHSHKKRGSSIPQVSVVMPVYNVESYVEEAICSILSQTYSDFEFIIINDGSTDNTAGVVKNIRDSRIIFIDSQENKGNYNRRNEGCRLAKGKYICMMDGDDMAMLNRIEKQVEIMERDPSLQAHGTAFVFSTGHVCRKPCDYSRIKVLLLFNNVFLHPSLMIRKEALEAVGYYNEKYYYSSDYDLACRLALRGKIINIPDILMRYRVHEKQISSAHYTKQTEFANQIRLDYLERCGLRLSREEKELFTLMMTDTDKARIQNENMRLVIDKLERQNQEIKCFDSEPFDLFLEDLKKHI